MTVATEYPADELLALSGIQHFCFCRRQWALIHVERQWAENALTAEGKLLHQRTDDPLLSEVRGGTVIARAMPVASYRLGLSGACDVVEFIPSPDGVRVYGRQGTYRPMPVEYKRGKVKADKSDDVQLCAQALCLEEMLSVSIPRGCLYYGETRRRVDVIIGEDLRELVRQMAAEMHAYFSRGYTPRVRPSKACRSCSLANVCLPELQGQTLSVAKYIQMHVDGD